MQAMALWLLHSIGAETHDRLAQAADQLFCASCVVRCHRHEIDLPSQGRMSYYGCRTCHQSLDFHTWPGGVAAVLDRNSYEATVQENDQIRVNWLVRRTLFDFDWVEIIDADDEAVERFAVQVGNDTDETRRQSYKKTPCLVASTCQLSENTIRILNYTFGSVEIDHPNEQIGESS